MPSLFVELFSEEIPARMQARAADDLSRLLVDALSALHPADVRTFYGARRIALAARVDDAVEASTDTQRGPRRTAPEAALAGFLRKHGAVREALREEGDFWVLDTRSESVPATAVIAAAMPPLLRRFPWPKSMRWGAGSQFTWVRPLRRIVCLLDGAVVPFHLRDGDDDGHRLASGSETEGHRFMAPGAVSVTGVDDWREGLLARNVIVEPDARLAAIMDGLATVATELQCRLVDDPGLLDEVAGLVEWPVVLHGRIDDAFMDLPPEVMQVSMRVNQRYFALRQQDGTAAPYFAVVANIEAADAGATIIAGNERVLRARFADARHFWDLDRGVRLADRVPALDGVVFHAKLGTQGGRVTRLVRLSAHLAEAIGADVASAGRAALLAKADLTTGMVGEFPELQGVMGGYYARHDGEDARVADAVRDHYAPKGVNDAVPSAPVTAAVALADKLDQICGFFGIGEKPSGSGDPFALRRAALGIIRIVRDNCLRFDLRAAIVAAADAHASPPDADEVFGFILERLRVQMRGDGARHDVLQAVIAVRPDPDLARLLRRSAAVADFIAGDDGRNLLAGARRAANILRIEDRKDGPHEGPVAADMLEQPAEHELFRAVSTAGSEVASRLDEEDFSGAMRAMAALRPPLDRFFDEVTVNADRAEVRRNRLRLLHRVRETTDRVADFSQIES